MDDTPTVPDPDYCERHSRYFAPWMDCPECEAEWLENHDQTRSIRKSVGIALMILIVIMFVSMPIMAIFARK